MSYEQKDGSGALFKNEKLKDTHPDYKGNIRINGVDLELAAWLKTSAKGVKYMSLNAQPKRDKAAKPEQEVPPYDDSIPF